MEKIKLSIALLLLFVLLSIFLSIGAIFIYANSFPYVLGTGLIASVVVVILFLIYAKNEVQI